MAIGDTALAPAGAVAGQHSSSLLQIENVTVKFGGIVALNDVSFDVKEGEIQGLIGPNGAGKTTLFNCLSRLYVPNSGDIKFEGQSIMSARVDQIAALGIGRTFQNLALFDTLSVIENVKIGCHCRSSGGIVSGMLSLPASRQEERQIEDLAWELIEYLGLQDVAYVEVGDLPFGTQKKVELARAMASQPKLLLLDEPAAGLNHNEVNVLADLIKQINEQRGTTILLVEHHMGLVMSISDTVVAIDFGSKIGEGKPSDIQRNPEVIRAYLGSSA